MACGYVNLGRSIPIVAQCIIDENIRIKYKTPFVKADETKCGELSKENRIAQPSYIAKNM